ncbi:MAG: UDP-3-O-(3-hydroxymyristoyl)glucosamine N-acyltransferase [Candidatus Wallbacteria bacterium]
MMYEKFAKTVTLEKLSEYLGEKYYGNGSILISGVAGINEAAAGDITFAVKPKYIKFLDVSKASAVIISPDVKEVDVKVPYIISKNPYYTFARVLEFFYPKKEQKSFVSPQAFIAASAKVGKNISIYPGVFIGENAEIGDNCVLYPNVFIGENVKIGNDTWIYSNVSIRENCAVGERCILHAGTVIGADGYGFVRNGASYYKTPQVGNVIIENDVEMGANVTCDRATIGSTKIGGGTKIDNLVHIAHNVQIGKNVLIVAQVGISGSVDVGDDVVIAGQSGIVGHISIGAGTVIAARSVVTSDVKPKSFVSGFPAKPHNEEMKIKAAMKKLPSIIKTVNELKKQFLQSEE